MKRKWVLAKKVGLLIASSSLFWAACQQGASLKLDTKTAKPLPLKKQPRAKMYSSMIQVEQKQKTILKQMTIKPSTSFFLSVMAWG